MQQILRHRLLPLAVLALGAVLTWMAVGLVSRSSDREMQTEFEARVVDGSSRVQLRMDAYQQVLRGVSGLLAAKGNVGRDDFQKYVGALGLAERYPGIQGVGFNLLVPKSARLAHEQTVRRSGVPNYEIRPPGDRDPYTTIVFIEPFTGRNLRALGFDTYSEPVRREAMDRAWRTGQGALTGRLTLVQETTQDVQAGVLMFLPVYTQGADITAATGRMASLRGWVSGVFRMNDLMAGILGSRQDDVGIRIYDGTEESAKYLLFDSHPEGQGGARLSQFNDRRVMDIAGRRWTMAFYSTAAFESRARTDSAKIVVTAGAVGTLLLAFVVYLLARGRARAEAANRVKSEFLATMSHEIRTPINGIVGMTSLALEGQLQPDQRENLEAVQQSADALLSIINDILDLSKIESGQVQLESIAMDVRSIVSGVLKMLRLNASTKGLTLAADIANDIPQWVAGDPTRLRQVLVNLVGNAVKFTAKGAVTLRVRCMERDEQGYSLLFEVQDTGIGIPAEKLESIFQPFTQAEASTTRQFGGTGLGLTISRKLVGMMGGRLAVDSTPGEGSFFHFTVRFAATQPPQSSQGDRAQTANTSLNILLVEDHPINQILAQKMLTRAGHKVSLAATGVDGVAQWRAVRPDVILMDVQMPVMDGLDATREIRKAEAREGLKRTPIIAMTANAFAEDRQACLDAGMDAYLSKPVKPEVLQGTLDETVTIG